MGIQEGPWRTWNVREIKKLKRAAVLRFGPGAPMAEATVLQIRKNKICKCPNYLGRPQTSDEGRARQILQFRHSFVFKSAAGQITVDKTSLKFAFVL